MNDILKGILDASWLQSLWDVSMGVVMAIVKVILWPFSALIQSLIPSLDGVFDSVGDYFDIISTYIGWVIDAMAIPSAVLVLITGYYTFIVMATLGAWGVKLILKWKKAIF